MNMNMKNEKTMLALVLVAALAMVSVAGVALASESDAIIITPTKTIVGADETYEGPLSVATYNTGDMSVLIINGTYTGTVSFYNVDPESEGAEPFATVVCNAVSGVTFTNVYSDATHSTVTVIGTQTGTVTLTSGAITLGNAVDASNVYTGSYTGTLTVSTYGTIVSGSTYGATVAIVATTSSVAEHVEVTGEASSLLSDFESNVVGITNEMLGNAITITKAESTSTYKYVITGTLAKIDLTGTSAMGTVLKTIKSIDSTYAYGIVIDNVFHVATVDSTTGAISFTGSDALPTDYDGSELTTVDASTGYVTGITGAIEFNLDFIANGVTINTTAISNGAVTVSAASVINVYGTFINNGALTLKANVTGSGQIISKGTFSSVSTSTTPITCAPNVSGYYTIVKSTDNTKETTTGYATLAEALEAAGSTGTVYVGGFVYLNENVTVSAEQKIVFQGYGITADSGNSTVVPTQALFALDGTASLVISGEAINYSGVPMIIASEASMDISEADITAGVCTDYNLVPINVNGTFTVLKTQMAGMLVTNFGLVSADTVSGTTTLTFDNLYNALTKATSGNVTLLRDVTLNKSATVADNVTLLNGASQTNNNKLTIAEDVTLTVNGHMQFYNNDHTIKGTLIINDTVTPASSDATKYAGSFITGQGNIFLTGTIQVSEGAVFEIGCNVWAKTYGETDNTKAAGNVIVNGTLNNAYYSSQIEGSFLNLKTLTVTATGIFNNNNAIWVKTAVIAGTVNNNYVSTIAGQTSAVQSYFNADDLVLSGTFNNVSTGTTAYNGKLIVNELTVLGTLNAGKYVVAGTLGVTVYKTATFGVANIALDDSAVTGTVALASTAYAIVYGSFDASEIIVLAADAKACTTTTTFYIGDDVYAMEYANGTAKLVLLDVTVSGMTFVGWYTAPVDGRIVTANNAGNIGGYIALYGILTVKTTAVTLSYTQNGTWVVDGASCGSSATLDLTVGTHTIKFVADNGYELGDDYVIYVDGRAISSDSFTVSDNKIVINYGGEVKEKSTDGGLDLVTILLIIITIVIIIMAIIIALKLMRS